MADYANQRTRLAGAILALLVVVALRPVGGARAQESDAPAGSALHVDVRDDRVTLRADGVPLEAVLRAIGERSGIDVIIRADLSEPTSRAFTSVSLHDAIRDLLGDASFLLSRDGRDGRGRLVVLGPAAPRILPQTPPQATDPDQEPWILERLESPDRNTRIVAVRRLDRLERDRAVAHAARILGTDEDPVVRGQVAAVLGRIGGDRAAALLDDALADPEAMVRQHALRALGEVGGSAAADILGAVLLEDTVRQTRLMAIGSLRKNHTEAAAAHLRTATQDPDTAVRETAARALEGWDQRPQTDD